MSIKNAKQTILNPSIPLTGKILGGLQPGEMVLIQGVVPEDSDRFHVDLQCGIGAFPSAVVAFHINPRFQQANPCIVCNTFEQEDWDDEEICNEMPFKLGAKFEMIIEVLKDMFKVVVNGVHVLEYKYRVDLKKVDTIAIGGMVQIDTIAFISSSLFVVEPSNLTLPFIGKMVQSLRPGNTIIIKGQVNPNPVCFFINLRVANTDQIALHINPRFKSGDFVCNSFLSGGWDKQEIFLPIFPFFPQQLFEIIIWCEADQFKVSVNGVHQLDFKYRTELSRVNELEINGDFHLLEVKVW